MVRRCYSEKRFSASSKGIIQQANEIITDYAGQGYDLTLRQLYYQFVSRDLIANKQSEYKRLGSIINDARLAGEIDWTAIVDRTRSVKKNSHWEGPREIVEACVNQYQIDKWTGQTHRPEVWIEKDALIGVIEPICRELDISYLSCRGYTSQSEMWKSSQRHAEYIHNEQIPVVLHLGDHDPSGIDMTRDILDRMSLFLEYDMAREAVVDRLALNMDQVDEYNPPPNPAKLTDSRCAGYMDKYGNESWELDALEPSVMTELIRENVLKYKDEEVWEKRVKLENRHKNRLLKAARGMGK